MLGFKIILLFVLNFYVFKKFLNNLKKYLTSKNVMRIIANNNNFINKKILEKKSRYIKVFRE